MMLKTASQALLLCAALATASVQAAADGDMAPSDKALAKLYWSGHDALRTSDWSVALERFRRLEADLRAKEPQSVDAAIYWQAYALNQAKRGAEARAQVERLHREFAGSRWSADADALLRTSAAPAPDNGDDLAEIAVESLMGVSSERAVPLLIKVLKGDQPERVKKRALFVLSQIDEPAALASLGEIARTSNEPGMREEAIRMLGMSGDPKGIEQLGAMFASSKSVEEKRRIVQAWLIAERPDLVLAAARNESDPAVRREAIQALGAMNAGNELVLLLGSEKDEENSDAILQSLGVAGDVKALAAIAESSRPERQRIEATRAIGIAGDSEALVRIYAKATTPALQGAVREGLMISGDGKALLKLYRMAKTAEEKREILRTLSLVGGDEAIDIIEAELGQGGGK
jgi:HEAT repeat protein